MTGWDLLAIILSAVAVILSVILNGGNKDGLA